MAVSARALAGTQSFAVGSFAVKALFMNYWRNESGATAIEYGLIAGLIAVVVITSVRTVGTKMSGDFSKVAANL